MASCFVLLCKECLGILHNVFSEAVCVINGAFVSVHVPYQMHIQKCQTYDPIITTEYL